MLIVFIVLDTPSQDDDGQENAPLPPQKKEADEDGGRREGFSLGLVFAPTPKLTFEDVGFSFLGEYFILADDSTEYEPGKGFKFGGIYFDKNIFAAIETEFFTQSKSKGQGDGDSIQPVLTYINVGHNFRNDKNTFKVFVGLGYGNLKYKDKNSVLDSDGDPLTYSVWSEGGVLLQAGFGRSFQNKYSIDLLYRSLENGFEGNAQYLGEPMVIDGKIKMQSFSLRASVYF